MLMLSVTLIAFFALFQVVKCGDNIHGSSWSRRHNPNDVAVVQHRTTLEKRFDGARFTFYAAGLGACGKVNAGSDFIVALNVAQFSGGAHCFQTITITVDGKSTQAQIMDMCMGCPYGGLDFSSGLFNFFASESVGVLTGSWVFGGAASSSTSSTPTPKSTSTYYPPPSSTSSMTYYTTSNSTSTQTPTPTSTQSSTSTSISATPTPSQATGNIADIFLIFVEVESILAIAHHG